MSSSSRSCNRCGQAIDSPSRFCPFCGAAQAAGTGENLTPTSRGAGSAWSAILERLQQATTPKYEVLRVLGYGGMAAVYLAIEKRLERQVAIKVMSPGLMIDPKLVERFQQEARTIAQLNHPNIVSIFEIDQREELHFFAMTYVAGRTLSQVMADAREPLPIPVVTAWLWQIGNALAYAHQRGIIHRDIKPENILLDADGNALVTDFGIAKVADSPGLTRTGIIVGTPAYMSPEQCSGASLTGASDQYAVGAVAYQMLVGQPPFVGPTLSVLQAHVSEHPRPIREARPDCPRDLADAVEQMLSKRADERFPDISAALVALGGAPLTVKDPRVPVLARLARHAVAIRFDRVPGALAEGEQHALGAVAVDHDEAPMEDRRVRWSSSDEQVAVVDEEGSLRAIRAGTAEITARSTEATASQVVTVVPGMVELVEVVPSESDVNTGEWVQLTPIVRRDGKQSEDAAVAWNSSDPAIATVTPEGVVEALGPGSATITATVGGKTGQTVVRVRGVPAGAVAPRPAPKRRSSTGGRTARKARVQVAARRRKLTLVAGAAVFLLVVAGAAMYVLPWSGTGAGPAEVVEPGIVPPTLADELDEAGPDGGEGAEGPAVAGFGEPGAAAPGPGPAVPAEVDSPADGRLVLGGDLPGGSELRATDEGGRSITLSGGTTFLAPGQYVLSFRAPGYQPEEARLRIRPAEPTRWTPALRPVVTAPPPVVATPEERPRPDPAPAQPAQPEPVGVEEPVPPVRDLAAERAAAEASVRRVVETVVGALNRRDVDAVLPAFQANTRDVWRQLLTNRDVQDWSAQLGDYRLMSMSDGNAEVAFTLRLAFRMAGSRQNQSPPYRGLLQGSGTDWRLLYIEPR